MGSRSGTLRRMINSIINSMKSMIQASRGIVSTAVSVIASFALALFLPLVAVAVALVLPTLLVHV